MDGLRLQRAVIVAVLVALAVPAPAAQAVDFVGPTDYSPGSNEVSLAKGDFNGDGDLDLVSVEYGGGVNVLLGTSGGGFGTPTPYPSGSGSWDVAVGNFNAGSDPDLAVANHSLGDNNVAALLGGSGGSFGSPTGYAAGNNPYAVAVDNFNGDSFQDLVVANTGTSGSETVSILLGGAGGSFGAPTSYPIGAALPFEVAVGNFNGDAYRDVVTANASSPGSVSVLLGGPGASLGSPTVYTTPNGSQAVTIGDFNGDSDPDLAVANLYADNISILAGSTGGTFTGPTNLALAANSYPSSVALGKFDANTDPDIAVANAGGNMAVLLGGAGTSFGSPAYFPGGASPDDIVVGDFDLDTDDDVAVSNYGDGKVSVYLQVDTLGFARPKSATPSTIKLVPAFNQCPGASPAGMTHGPPLAVPSCSPPAQSSSYLTLNAPDRPAPYNTAAAGVASLYMKVFCDNSQAPPCPAVGDQIDIELSSGVTDVRCVAAGPNCSAAGAVYAGKLLFHIPLRITDKLNGSGQTAGATVMDTQFQFGAQCSFSSCSVATSVDSVIPGFAKEGKRAVLGLGRIEVRDGGPDGDLVDAPLPAVGTCPPVCTGNGGETVFLHQGFLVP